MASNYHICSKGTKIFLAVFFGCLMQHCMDMESVVVILVCRNTSGSDQGQLPRR